MQKTKLTLIASAMLSLTFGQVAQASSHREAPNITRLPTVDSTDFYAFNSYEEGRGEYVTLIANYIPLQDAYGGPNYFAMDPAAVYAIHVDSDGDAVEDMSFTFNFSQALPNDNAGVALMVGAEGEQKAVGVPLKNVGGISASDQANANFTESYTVNVVSGPMRTGTSAAVMNDASGSASFGKPLDYIGNKTFANAEQYKAYADSFIYSATIPGCDSPAKVFVGQRKDPFAVNLGQVFDLVNTSIAIEVAKSCLVGSGNGSIGAWTTASLPQARILNPNASFDNTEVNGGAMTQVSRLGSPLVNELVIGLADKDTFSSAAPKDDGQFADYVTHPTLPELLNILFKDAVNTTLGTDIETLAPTNFPRTDLVTAFLTGFEGVNQLSVVTPSEMLRLNTSIAAKSADMQSPFGVAGDDLAGFPNGRRPGDDVVDIALRVVMGRLCYPIPVNGEDTDLGLCTPEDASVGNVPFTDGAPSDATMMDSSFPYLAMPLPGSGAE